MRIVVVSDRGLSREALADALSRVPGAAIVATVDEMGKARAMCLNGETDAVVADVAAIGRASLAGGSLGELVVHGIGRLAGQELATAVVAHGRPWAAAGGRARQLSAREHEIFMLVGTGLSNRQIARNLGISEQTVKTHVGNILAKLRLTSRLQAGLAAIDQLAGGSASVAAQPGQVDERSQA